MDQSPPPSPQRSQARGRRNERDHCILESPTRRRIAPPSGLAPPASLHFQNLPAHLAQQLAALPALPARRGSSRLSVSAAPALAPARNLYPHLPNHLAQQLAALPTLGHHQSIPAPAPAPAPVVPPPLGHYPHLSQHLAQQLAALPPLPVSGQRPVTIVCALF